MLKTAGGIFLALATAATPIAAQAAESVRASSAVVKRTTNTAPPIAFSRSSAELTEENGLLGNPALLVVLLLAGSAVTLGLVQLFREDSGVRSPN